MIYRIALIFGCFLAGIALVAATSKLTSAASLLAPRISDPNLAPRDAFAGAVADACSLINAQMTRDTRCQHRPESNAIDFEGPSRNAEARPLCRRLAEIVAKSVPGLAGRNYGLRVSSSFVIAAKCEIR